MITYLRDRPVVVFWSLVWALYSLAFLIFYPHPARWIGGGLFVLLIVLLADAAHRGRAADKNGQHPVSPAPEGVPEAESGWTDPSPQEPIRHYDREQHPSPHLQDWLARMDKNDRLYAYQLWILGWCAGAEDTADQTGLTRCPVTV